MEAEDKRRDNFTPEVAIKLAIISFSLSSLLLTDGVANKEVCAFLSADTDSLF